MVNSDLNAAGTSRVSRRPRRRGLGAWALYAATVAMGGVAIPCQADDSSGVEHTTNESLKNTPENRAAEKLKHHEPDFSGKKRVGKASFYARKFAGRQMANG